MEAPRPWALFFLKRIVIFALEHIPALMEDLLSNKVLYLNIKRRDTYSR